MSSRKRGVRRVRWLRETADYLSRNADEHRTALIKRLGLKRYIFNALGHAAHCPAADARLLWPDGVEPVQDGETKLGDYLHARAEEEARLPQAVVISDRKYYL